MNPVAWRIRNTALVRESDPGHQRRLLVVLWAVVAVAVPAFFYVWLQTRFVAQQYELQEVRTRLEQGRERQLVLDARLEELSSPARVRDRVRRLGLDLAPPEPGTARLVRILQEEPDGEVFRAGAAGGSAHEGRR